ncbi:hypothetical protein [Pseudomonas sp. BN515]|uniref:hypothetical protein n=1 Tax=Pseudomonas sp. BN515 TaxID=2567892 RepID=UPI0024565EBF|nr:hypothetical protein [Pseudomonas sp. BN515]MDH4872032.1 hypothetical protein [Pseudomonas sp. BN515]
MQGNSMGGLSVSEQRLCQGLESTTKNNSTLCFILIFTFINARMAQPEQASPDGGPSPFAQLPQGALSKSPIGPPLPHSRLTFEWLSGRLEKRTRPFLASTGRPVEPSKPPA